MPDIIEDIDEVIAGWERGPDAYRWNSKIPSLEVPVNTAPVPGGSVTVTMEDMSTREIHDTCCHNVEDAEHGRVLVISSRHLCAICNAS